MKNKINYLRIALGLAGIVTNNRTSDLIMYETMLKKGSNFSIHDSAKIEAAINKKYEPKKRKK